MAHLVQETKVKSIDRFIKKIKINANGCWEWQGYCTNDGHGLFARTTAHRWFYQHIHNKLLDPNIFVCHICDNPPCVNPSHLFEGTPQQNVDDMIQKGRQKNSHKGIKHPNSRLTEQQVLAIRNDGRRPAVIAREYGITLVHLLNIKNKKVWRHI